MIRFSDLRLKEVICVRDGGRFGYVGDLEFDPDSGRVAAVVIPGRLRLFGLLGREPETRIPWERVTRFGEDTVLVDSPAEWFEDDEKRRPLT